MCALICYLSTKDCLHALPGLHILHTELVLGIGTVHDVNMNTRWKRING